VAFPWGDLAKFLDIRKVPPQVWLAIALAAGTVLLVPITLAERLGVAALRTSHAPHFGLAFILATSMLVARALAFVGRIVKDYTRRWRDRRQLAYLTPDQKAVLRRYIDEDTCTLNFRIDDGVAQGLLLVGLLHRASPIFDMVEGTPYNVQPWLWRLLKKRPELLAGAKARKSEEGDTW
jgi:hypothetical protein